MPKPNRMTPLSDGLRKAILRSKLSLLDLERATGVKRQSLMRFLKDDRTLRLDIADKLAAYFNLQLTERKAK